MKKLISLLLTAAMFLSLTACGGGDSSSAPADSDSGEAPVQVGDGYVLGESEKIEDVPAVNTNPLRSEFYNDDGVLMGNVSYEYDGQGRLTKKVFTWLEDFGGTEETTEYGYDDEGHVIFESQSYDYDPQPYITNRVYKNGLLISEEAYGMKTVYTYNDKNQIVQTVAEFSDGTSGQPSPHFYDDKGNLVRRESYFGDKIDTVWEWAYNDDGTVAQQTEDFGFLKGSYKYYHNDAKQLVKTESYTNDELMYTLNCEYDEYGRIVVEGTVMEDWKFNGNYLHYYE